MATLSLASAEKAVRREFAAETRALSEVNNLRAAWALARQWMVIAAAVALALYAHHWIAWVVAGIIIATRQIALTIMMHEAAHYHLFSNRRLNDWISDWCCALPLHLTTAGYRCHHLQHHNSPNTPDDPNWTYSQEDPDGWLFPQGPRETLRVFAFDLLGLHTLRWLQYFGPWMYSYRLRRRTLPRLTISEHVNWISFHAVLVTSLTFAHGWIPYLLLWLVPSLTLGTALHRMRALAEHPFTPASTEIQDTRFVEGTLIERHSIAPLNVNYHLEHHLFPSVPYYHLPALHKLLVKRGIYEPGRNYFRTYLGLRDGVLGWLAGRCRSLLAETEFRSREPR